MSDTQLTPTTSDEPVLSPTRPANDAVLAAAEAGKADRGGATRTAPPPSGKGKQTNKRNQRAEPADLEARAMEAAVSALTGRSNVVAPELPPSEVVAQSPLDAPLIEGQHLARELLAEEQAERERRFRDRELATRRRNAGVGGTRRPMRAIARRRRADRSVPVDSKGAPIVMPGKILRWVRDEDYEGRPDLDRVEDFSFYGYEVVLDPYTKEPVRSIRGVLMAGDPESYAERAVAYMKEGALRRSDNPHLAAADDIARDIERRSGTNPLYSGRDRMEHESFAMPTIPLEVPDDPGDDD